MPYRNSGGGSGAGIIYVYQLPSPELADRRATYGRISDVPVSLWRISVEAMGTVTTFSDSSGRYKGAHNANPSAPSHADDYYYNSISEHFRVARIQIGGTLYTWVNPSSAINNYLPNNYVWIDGDGSETGRGAYDSDDGAEEYLDTQQLQSHENYVFYSRADGEVRSVSGTGFINARPIWQDVSSGTGGVPGATGPQGNQGATGPAGTDGADGATGASGLQGPAGADGSNGLNGAPGLSGTDGDDGSQGRYKITVYMSASLHPSTPPTGGSVVVDTGVVTPPAGWVNEPPSPGIGEFTYGTEYIVNPVTQTGTVTPIWSTVYLFSGPRGSHGSDGPEGPEGPEGPTGPTGPDGSSGLQGSQGPQGTIIVQLFQNATSPPATPTGGSYDIDTGALVVPAGWTAAPTTLGAGELTYISQDTIDPATQTGIITPTWSVPFQAGATGPQGQQGDQGIQGNTGPAGPAGADGSDGADGAQGNTGSSGAQGIYTITIYRNAATVPNTPNGGTVIVATGVVSPPNNWANTPITPPSGQRTWVSEARVNPVSDVGTLIPSWLSVSQYSGHEGPQGQQGQQGTTGNQGATGSTGADGADGSDGADGVQGSYTVTVYRSAGLHPNAPPTGGEVVVATGVVTPPTGWHNDPPSPGIGEFTYGTKYRVNPTTQSGTVIPIWGTVYLFSGPRGSQGSDGPTGPDGPTGATGAAGSTGQQGDQGAQGEYIIQIFRNATSIPSTPTGGSYNVDTAALTPPTDWTADPTTPGATELTYISQDTINPATQTGAITPSWSPPFQAGAAGPQGPAGPRGNAGPAGADGTNGSDGADGSQGPQGDDGPVGSAGNDGNDGRQGIYIITVYRNAANQPATPAGGTVVVDTGVVSPPNNWSNSPITPGPGQNVWASQARVNPASNVGTLIPSWLGTYQFSGPEGQQGQQGQQGAQGAAGSDGSDGADGQQGNAGSDGADGSDGQDGAVGPAGPAASLERTGAQPQVLSGNIDWDTVTDAGFYNVATGSVQTNTPAGTPLGACHVFSSQTYAVQIGWTFEQFARTFTRTRPGPAGTAFANWERIHIPIDAIVTLLEARTGDDRLQVSALRGIIPVSMLPAEVLLETELTAARIRGLLGLSAQEVNDLFTGATIAGQVITYTQNDGTVVTITVPAGGMTDGVVASATLVGTILTLTLSTGTTVTVDLAGLQVGGAAFRQEILPFTAITPNSSIQGFAYNVSLADVPQDSYLEIELQTVNGIIFGDKRHVRDFRAGPAVTVGQSLPALGVYGFRGLRGEDISSLGSNAAIGVYYGWIDDNTIGVASSNSGDDPFDFVRVVITPLSGVTGAQGRYDVSIYRNAVFDPPTPTGGSIDVSTGVVTAPADWSINPGPPITGQNIYVSRVTINPLSQSGVITPTWSTPFEAAGIGPPGPQGSQGPAGSDGADGADGQQGPQGDQGATGAAGADGADGTNGSDGADGSQGPQGDQGVQGTQGPTGPIGPGTSVIEGAIAQNSPVIQSGLPRFRMNVTTPGNVEPLDGQYLKFNFTGPFDNSHSAGNYSYTQYPVHFWLNNDDATELPFRYPSGRFVRGDDFPADVDAYALKTPDAYIWLSGVDFLGGVEKQDEAADVEETDVMAFARRSIGQDPTRLLPVGDLRTVMARGLADRTLSNLGLDTYALRETAKVTLTVPPPTKDLPFGEGELVGTIFDGTRTVAAGTGFRGALWVITVGTTETYLNRVNTYDPTDDTAPYGVIGTLPSGIDDPMSLIALGNRLYVVNGNDTSAGLWRVNPDDPGDTSSPYGRIGSFTAGLANPRGGFATLEGNMYVFETGAPDEIWAVDPADPDGGVSGFVGPLPTAIDGAPTGGTWHDGYAYAASGRGRAIWRISLVGGTFNGDTSPSQLYGRVGIMPIPDGANLTALASLGGQMYVMNATQLWAVSVGQIEAFRATHLTVQDSGTEEAEGNGLILNFGTALNVEVVGNVVTINGIGGTIPTPNHALYVGWSGDTTPEDSEFTASSDTHTITVPTATGSLYLIIWRSDADGGDPTEVHISGGGNSRNLFDVAMAYTLNGVAGQVIVSGNTFNADFTSGETLRVV